MCMFCYVYVMLCLCLVMLIFGMFILLLHFTTRIFGTYLMFCCVMFIFVMFMLCLCFVYVPNFENIFSWWVRKE